MSKIGLIGGSGLYDIKGFILKQKKTVTTPYGKPSDQYLIGKIGNTEIVFLPRHGKKHNMPPHMINYRANIWGFKKLSVDRIISISAVGGIKKGFKPGDIVVLDQIMDMTRNRKSTFYDGKGGVMHIDFTEPYCPELRDIILKAGKQARISLKNGGNYVAVEGPRLETASEIKGFKLLGGDVVGMTGMPEASLAREAAICYSGISVVANYAAGISKTKLTVPEVMEAMNASTEKLKQLLKKTFSLISEERKCTCKDALKEAKI
ncbi:S-methyl-5'-thioinosine phosphorylase [bacterium BMS3Bbin09]|nr:S-methyl-5'-thioinosine phosphorylase [bacterium BMS3Bbin09]HDH34103.1 S-methyl-5'-thioadenosine phosphorylase [Nitrospirota bacterium]HDN95084.1 S-methyl-5'-thioadenosine phosphorylase [Nitrospirota bacterium]